MRQGRFRVAVLGMVVVAMGLSLVVVSDAGAAIVICKNKNGKKILLRDGACKSKETQVSATELGVTGPQGPQGSTGAQGAQGPQGLPGIPVKINYRAAAGAGDTEFLNLGGLSLTGNCAAGTLTVTARTAVDEAILHYGVISFNP